ncbi:MazG nucleotide pyrophosphohydrolase domain-containing protein [Aliikangiella coralliicola]|uniref:Nucleotide pyrophosphohydrolase n=1 Tax=Aliikangiella coralliicola TaxID=2592383 RepID=A0A545UFJ4_9GAMM|nr:MazG nucleotide pyrophosphohydrolase domain-containing protein [Aliikangiella coralliicola]TQV88244.1 nucleotide pyrophosphohydrolase [Aliikangiella coralliicola]
MEFNELKNSAIQLNNLYEKWEFKEFGRKWSTQELALGFVGDVGDLAKLVQANAGVRNIDDHKTKLEHELADCLWSIIVLAGKCDVDLESAFKKNIKELIEYMSDKLNCNQ